MLTAAPPHQASVHTVQQGTGDSTTGTPTDGLGGLVVTRAAGQAVPQPFKIKTSVGSQKKPALQQATDPVN